VLLGRATINPHSTRSKLCLVSVVYASQSDNSNASAGPVVLSNPKPAMTLTLHWMHSVSPQREEAQREMGATKPEPRDGHTMPCAKHNRRRDAYTGFLGCVLLFIHEAVRQACAWLRKRMPQAHHSRIPEPVSASPFPLSSSSRSPSTLLISGHTSDRCPPSGHLLSHHYHSSLVTTSWSLVASTVWNQLVVL
jgi:hypothetical protein